MYLSASEVGHHGGPVHAEPSGELLNAVAGPVRGDQVVELDWAQTCLGPM